MQHFWKSPVMAIPYPQFSSPFHCLTVCPGKCFPWSILSPVALRKEPASISLDAVGPSLVALSSWTPPAEPVFPTAASVTAGLAELGSPSRASAGVPGCELWVCGWVGLGFGTTWAVPGLQLCSGWTTAFSGPPSSAAVRWIRDDLPLVNYITVNVSYITAAPPKIMAKILLTFWCCFMYFM